MSRLFVWNPLDWMRLLWWALVKPDALQKYKKSPAYEGEEEFDKVGNCLSGALACWPLVLSLLWIRPRLAHLQAVAQGVARDDRVLHLVLQYCPWIGSLLLLSWLLVTFLYRFELTEKAESWKKVVGWVPLLTALVMAGVGAFVALKIAAFAIKVGVGGGAAVAVAVVVAIFASFAVAFGTARTGIYLPVSAVLGTAVGVVVGAGDVGGVVGGAVDVAGGVVDVLGVVIDLLGGQGEVLLFLVVFAIPIFVGAFVHRSAREGHPSRLARGVFWSLMLSYVTLLWQVGVAGRI